MTDPNHSLGIQRDVFIALLLLAGLRVLFLFIPSSSLWGINYFHYLPLGFSLLLIGLSVGMPFLLRPKTKAQPKAKATKSKLGQASTPSTLFSIRSPLILLSGAIVGLTLFLSFPIAWALLGDGTLYLGFLFKFDITGHYILSGMEPATLFLLQFIFALSKGLGLPHELTFPFRLIDAASGLLFVVYAILFARKQEGISSTALLLLLSCAGLLYFFGYIETYAPEYAVSLVFFYLAYLYFQGQARFAIVCLVLLLACVLHSQNVVLIPAAAIAYYLKHARRVVYRRLYIALFACIPALLVVYLILLHVPAANGIFIPPGSHLDERYTLLASQHLIDIVNEHLLLASVPCAILLVALLRFRSMSWHTPYVLFLVTALIFEEAFVVGGNTVFGLARDWDIFGTLGLSLTLLSIEWLRQNADDIGIQLRLAISLSAVAGVVAWIVLNVQAGSAIHRCEDILAQYRTIIGVDETHYGYENIRKYYNHENLEGEITTIRKMVEVQPSAIDVDIAMTEARQAGDRLDEAGRVELETIIHLIRNNQSDSVIQAEEFGKTHLRLGPPHSGDNITLGDQYAYGTTYLWATLHRVTLEGAIAETDSFILRHPRLPYGYEVKGLLLMNAPHQDNAAVQMLRESISLDTNRPKPYLLLATLEQRMDSSVEARTHFRCGLVLDPTLLNALTAFAAFLQTRFPRPSDSADVALLERDLQQLRQEQPYNSNYMNAQNRSRSERAAAVFQALERWWASLPRQADGPSQ